MAEVQDLHPVVRIAMGTAGSYLLLLGIMFVLLFGLPYLAFRVG